MLAIILLGFLIGGLGGVPAVLPQIESEPKRRQRLVRRKFSDFSSKHALRGTYPVTFSVWPPPSRSVNSFSVPLARYEAVDAEDNQRWYGIGKGKPYEILEAWVHRTGNSLVWTDARLAVLSFSLILAGAALAIVGAAT